MLRALATAGTDIADARSTFTGALSGAATSATTAGTVTTAAQPNITSVGTLTSLTVSGNTTSGNFVGVFANGNSNVSIPAANGNVNISAAGNANILVVTGTGAAVTGTLSANTIDISNVANFSSASNVTLGNVSNLHISGGTANYLLSTDGSGNLSWAAPGASKAAAVGYSLIFGG
jgi:hypothetical protein